MTDRDDIVFLSTTASVPENLDRIGTSPHARFPLIGDDPGDFRGIVHVPTVVDWLDDLRRGDVTFEDIAAPPNGLGGYLHQQRRLPFPGGVTGTRLVCDDSSAVVGLITATDCLEAVMGEIEDPLNAGLQQRGIPQ